MSDRKTAVSGVRLTGQAIEAVDDPQERSPHG
jgi:hypothetical protein